MKVFKSNCFCFLCPKPPLRICPKPLVKRSQKFKGREKWFSTVSTVEDKSVVPAPIIRWLNPPEKVSTHTRIHMHRHTHQYFIIQLLDFMMRLKRLFVGLRPSGFGVILIWCLSQDWRLCSWLGLLLEWRISCAFFFKAAFQMARVCCF